MIFVLVFAVGVAAYVPALPSTAAQDPKAADRQDEPQVELGAELILLDVSVADRSGRPVTTLPKSRFAVFEDGSPQDIEFFSSADAPASIAFVLDTSGSMRLKIRQTAEAAARILDSARPGDEFAVIEFKDTANLIEEFTSDPGDVRDALSGLQAVGQTAMLDAAYLSADYVQHDGRNRLKAVVLVTGSHRTSTTTARSFTSRQRRRRTSC
jgi:Ca-activated chloride channel family protein